MCGGSNSLQEESSQAMQLLQEQHIDEETFGQWMRVSKEQFYEILSLVESSLAKKDTRLRKPRSAKL